MIPLSSVTQSGFVYVIDIVGMLRVLCQRICKARIHHLCIYRLIGYVLQQNRLAAPGPSKSADRIARTTEVAQAEEDRNFVQAADRIAQTAARVPIAVDLAIPGVERVEEVNGETAPMTFVYWRSFTNSPYFRISNSEPSHES